MMVIMFICLSFVTTIMVFVIFLLEPLHRLLPLKVPVSSLLLISRLFTMLGSLEYPIRLLLLATPLFPHLTSLANPVSPLRQLAPPFPLLLIFLLVVQVLLPDINRPTPIDLSHGSMLISTVPLLCHHHPCIFFSGASCISDLPRPVHRRHRPWI